ncbi:MAG: CAP domain-containing protein [Clostridiales bacterium]|nr:CAP domain-containing protein [Clostridiales bacterium]
MKKLGKIAAATMAASIALTNTALASQTYPEGACTGTYNDTIIDNIEEAEKTVFDFLPLWNAGGFAPNEKPEDNREGSEAPEKHQLPSQRPTEKPSAETTEKQTEGAAKETQAETTTKAIIETTTEATTEAAKETTTKAPVPPAAETTTKAVIETTTETTTKAPAAATEAPTETTTAASASSSADTGMAEQILQLVNKERAAAGLSSLTLDSSLNNAAALKAQDMADNNYFSHTSPTYGTPFQMLSSLGISYKSAGENIAKGQKSAEAVMTAWMNSEGHKTNILSSSYGKLGVGYVNKNGTAYWVQIFTD